MYRSPILLDVQYLHVRCSRARGQSVQLTSSLKHSAAVPACNLRRRASRAGSEVGLEGHPCTYVGAHESNRLRFFGAACRRDDQTGHTWLKSRLETPLELLSAEDLTIRHHWQRGLLDRVFPFLLVGLEGFSGVLVASAPFTADRLPCNAVPPFVALRADGT